MAREFDSEIYITADDKWIFRGNEIIQEDILSYFRKNLKQDERGVYIDNKFGELEEHGYLTLYGFPVHITYVSEEGGTLFFSTDADRTLGLDDISIQMNSEGQLFAHEMGREKILYRFSRSAGGQLAERIDETEDGSFVLKFNGEEETIIQATGSS
ncbi:MAG: hypothetical protein JJT78_14170 [Leptospira sp.]|nr:hypothetical protein [Leptospira sp.]